MSVTDQDPRNSYIANGVTKTFAYTFKIFEDSDLVVKVDGVTKTLTTDYTVTGAGASGGGNVIFNSDPTDEALVDIYRNLPYTRETDYLEDLLSDTLNDDIDRTVMLIQQDRRDRTRALKVPMSETGDQVIDDAATRAGGILGFNDTTGAIETKFAADMGLTGIGDGLQLVGDVVSVKTGEGLKIDSGALAVDPLEVITPAGGSMTGAINEAADTIAAHATTCDIWSKPNNLTLTGDAVTFTDFPDAPQAGATRWIKSNAAHVLTNNANLIVQGGANVTLASGDWIKVEAITTTTFNILVFRADGTALVCSTVASQAEMEAAADNTKMVTPLNLRYSPHSAKAWISFNGFTLDIYWGWGFTSVIDMGTGWYRLTFTQLSSNNYCPLVSAGSTVGLDRDAVISCNYGPYSTVFDVYTGAHTTRNNLDVERVFAAIFGDF